jgi:hypothetical protein
VAESDAPGVQKLARGLVAATPLAPPAVHLVPDHGMADVGQMNPNLVGPAGLEAEIQQRPAP